MALGLLEEYRERVFDRFFRILGTRQTSSGRDWPLSNKSRTCTKQIFSFIMSTNVAFVSVWYSKNLNNGSQIKITNNEINTDPKSTAFPATLLREHATYQSSDTWLTPHIISIHAWVSQLWPSFCFECLNNYYLLMKNKYAGKTLLPSPRTVKKMLNELKLQQKRNKHGIV